MGNNLCLIATYGVDDKTSTVLQQAVDVLKTKFYLRGEYFGNFNPPLMGVRDDQYYADAILIQLKNLKPPSAVALLGITPYDIYSDGLNFVFGIASPYYRVAVVSYDRLRTPIKELFISRVRKEITHEMGHVFGLEHCTTPGCVMNFSNSLYEVDLKSEDFCESCRRKLEKALRELGVI